jgi:Erythromycin esterase
MLRIQSHRPLHTKNVRDRCMAENVAWILKHEGPISKIVLWSHNFHACKEPAPPGTGTMGAELDRRFGRQQVVIGFAFGRGSFRATSESISIYEEGHPKRTPFTENPAGPAAETSIDGVFRRAGIPIFALDLRGGPREGTVADWLKNRHGLRDVGGLYVPESDENHYYPVVPARAFDVMIFTEETTASQPNAAVRERMKMPAVLPHERDFLPGTWRVASVEISTTETDLDKDARRRFLETKQEVGRVVASLRAGELTITLTLRADGWYTHELRSSRPAEPPYSEVGTWDLDSSSGVIAGKPKSKPASTIDGFRIRRLTRDDLVLRKDFVGDREGSFEVLRLERVR